jgi:uncharacterized protein YbaP (TraB family)
MRVVSPCLQAALQRLDASKALVVELDPRRSEAQSLLLAAARLPPGQSLDQQLPPAQWQALMNVASELGLPAEALAPMRPWMVSVLLSLTAAQQAGYEASQGIDLTLIQRAAEHGLALEELETVESQIAALGAGSAQEQREALMLTIDQLRSGRLATYLEALVGAWRAGDEAEIGRLLREGMPADSALSRALIEDRNIKMAARIARSMQDGRMRFVVVGAAHLIGPEGIPALLAKRGYRVRQLRDGE